MNTVNPIAQLHSEHTEWINKLSFYKDDLAVWQKRLEEIVKRNTSREIMANVDQFQNKLIVQKEQIDILRHEIKKEEINLEATLYDRQTGIQNAVLRDRVIRFEELFAEMRRNLLSFLAKWM
jgi:hypothetical protein